MTARLRPILALAALVVLTACAEGNDLIAPKVDEAPGAIVVEGNVKWFCWLENGVPWLCYVKCEDAGDQLMVEPDGTYWCDTPAPPGEGDEDPPPGGGGGVPPQTDSTDVSISCDQGVLRGQVGACRLLYPPWLPVQSIEWSSIIPDHSPSQIGGNEWSGVIVQDINVSVDFILNDSTRRMGGRITVENRAWNDWSTAFQYSQGTAPACNAQDLWTAMQSGASLGWVVGGLGCSQPSMLLSPDPALDATYDVEEVVTGPNQGMWYLKSKPMQMHLSSNLLPDLRGLVTHPVGLQSPSAVTNPCPNNATTPQVNTCTTQTNDFGTMVQNIWTHESRHYDKAVDAGNLPQGDLWNELEPMVGYQESDLLQSLKTRAQQINGFIAIAADGADVGTHGPYSFYTHQGSGLWTWYTATLQGIL